MSKLGNGIKKEITHKDIVEVRNFSYKLNKLFGFDENAYKENMRDIIEIQQNLIFMYDIANDIKNIFLTNPENGVIVKKTKRDILDMCGYKISYNAEFRTATLKAKDKFYTVTCFIL